MEKMPYRPELDTAMEMIQTPAATEVVSSDWRTGLPVLTGKRVALRELRMSDAASLFAMLTTEEVARFISPPPSTVEGFERFSAWTWRQRAAGTYVCYAVTLHGFDHVGVKRVRQRLGHLTSRRVAGAEKQDALLHGASRSMTQSFDSRNR